jgi:hypothetical protein
LSRRVAPGEGPQFAAWVNASNPQGKKPAALRAFPTQATKGRLRLVRTGAVIAYHVAADEAAEFTLLHQFPLGDDDLQAISLVGTAGGFPTLFDVRLTDLHVRAGSLAQTPPLRLDKALGRSRAMVFTAFLIIALMFAGAWLYLRRNRRADTSAPMVTPAERDEP